MARTNYAVFAARKGATLTCSKDGAPILKGERYMWVKPRSSYRKLVRCMAHPFKQSEITTSKMAGVYAAQENATDELTALTGQPGDVGDLSSILEAAAESIREVAQEYRDAAEASPTGLVFGEDLNEKADEIEDAAGELESWSADEDEPDFDQCENVAHEESNEEAPPVPPLERGSDLCDDCVEIRNTWWDDQVDSAISAVSDLSV
jgi:hypothetical protein